MINEPGARLQNLADTDPNFRYIVRDAGAGALFMINDGKQNGEIYQHPTIGRGCDNGRRGDYLQRNTHNSPNK